MVRVYSLVFVFLLSLGFMVFFVFIRNIVICVGSRTGDK